MKKLLSLLTVFALLLQMGTVGTFAATPNKALFTAVSEVYGVYAIGDNHTELSVFAAKKMEHMLRDYTTTKFYVNRETEFTVTSIKYALSKDKKTVTAAVVYADKTKGNYEFKKDSKGIVNIQFESEYGVDIKCPKTYATVDLATKYVKSDKFKATLKLEAALVKEVDEYLAGVEAIRENYNDKAPINNDNILEGSYLDATNENILQIEFDYDFDHKTYKNLVMTLDATLLSGDEEHYVFGENYAVEGNEMTIFEDDKNFITITAIDRSTITHILVVEEGNVVYDEDVAYTLSLE